MSPNLALHFLGSPQLYLNKTLITVERRKAVALLAYLAIERERHQRDILSSLFWPDYQQSKAYANLRHTLWEVQQAIGEGWIDADREQIGLNEKADIWLDVTHFKSLLDQSRTQTDVSLRISLLADSAKLYRNHFLTGFSLKDAYPFNEWAYAESEDLRLKFADLLTMLSEDHCSLNEAEKAIPYARRLLTLDPLNEASHRLLMDVYIQARQHSAALKQYQTLEQTLRKELNIDPQPETHELYKRIRKGEIHAAPIAKPTEIVTPKHNLPFSLTTFIGREKEQTEITNLIAKNRLVTLVGTGGIGKTSLSLQLGHNLLKEYLDGVWFIALDSLTDPDLVPQIVASVFDIRESTERSTIDILTNVLREKTSLLILDNCEHLLDACAQLTTVLLTNCPNIKFLTTSREVLKVTGEATYQMPSLSLPDQDKASLEELTENDSVRLFVERGMLALSSFALTNENAPTVIDICHKVDGIPLAIELAAAYVNILQVEEILKQLNDSFALLTSDSRISSTHHQSLQASMDWSWGLLNEAEQTFLQQLSVFAGGWTIETAQGVCDGDVFDLTNSLVKKSLIVVKQKSGSETRYRFHEIVRQYMREKLTKSGEEADIRTRHLNYFLSLSEQAELGLRSPQQEEWIARLNIEIANLRGALEWAGKTNSVEHGLYLSSRLLRFWEEFDFPEGIRWLMEFIKRKESHTYPRARAQALKSQARLFWGVQQFTQMLSAAEESLTLFRACGDQQGEVDALLQLARAIQTINKMSQTQTLELRQQALAKAQSLGDIWRQANSLADLGFWNIPNFKSRVAYWEKAVALYREAGDVGLAAGYLGLIGNFEMLNGDFESAQKRLDESNQLGQRLNHWLGDFVFSIQGRMASRQGDFERARTLLQDILTDVEHMGFRMSILWTRAHLGYLALQEGNIEEARNYFYETVQNFHKDQAIIGVAFTLEGLAGLYVATSKHEQAARLIGFADAARNRMNDTRPLLEQADVDKIITAIMAKIGSSAFEVAYDDGRGMTMDEAVELALGEN